MCAAAVSFSLEQTSLSSGSRLPKSGSERWQNRQSRPARVSFVVRKEECPIHCFRKSGLPFFRRWSPVNAAVLLSKANAEKHTRKPQDLDQGDPPSGCCRNHARMTLNQITMSGISLESNDRSALTDTRHPKHSSLRSRLHRSRVDSFRHERIQRNDAFPPDIHRQMLPRAMVESSQNRFQPSRLRSRQIVL